MSDINDDESTDDTSVASGPMCGDSSLQLFSQGWTPTEQVREPDHYQGRHRAAE